MDIKATTERLISRHGTCNPFRICKDLEIIIVHSELGSETRGLIRKYKRSYIICINSELDELEQLKTCAHELGHYMLHRNVNTLFMRTCTYLKTDRYEIEATEFGNLLLKNILDIKQT